jgi:hypothetical protein
LGRAGLSNGHSNTGFSSNGGHSRFSEDFLNRTFHFHNPFDIFEQFMSHFGMEDDFGKFIKTFSQKSSTSPVQCFSLNYILFLDKWSRHLFHFGEGRT